MAAAAEITEVKKTDFSVIRILNNPVYLEKINNYVTREHVNEYSIIKVADNIFAYNNVIINDDHLLSTDIGTCYPPSNILCQFRGKSSLSNDVNKV